MCRAVFRWNPDTKVYVREKQGVLNHVFEATLVDAKNPMTMSVIYFYPDDTFHMVFSTFPRDQSQKLCDILYDELEETRLAVAFSKLTIGDTTNTRPFGDHIHSYT